MFDSVVRNYLHSLQSAYTAAIGTGEGTPELSYRPALDQFFKELTVFLDKDSQISQIFEPRAQNKSGRPDWRFFNKSHFGVYGFVEAKALELSKNIDPAKNQEQIKKYLDLDHNLILTDGLDFVFYLKKKAYKPECHSIVSKPLISGLWVDCKINPLVENVFREFFDRPQARSCNEEQLVESIALRAHNLADEVCFFTGLPVEAALTASERRTIETLFSFKKYLTENHDPALTSDKHFADFVAQVLCFGLLYSHRSQLTGTETPEERYHKIHEYWVCGLSGPHRDLRPFHELIVKLQEQLIPGGGTEGTLSVWYDDCRQLLSYVTLTSSQQESPDYHKLFESFLEKFDPRARFDFGAFYTPQFLSSFTVRLINKLSDLYFNSHSIYAPNNKLIDPCCGTGTFIEQLLVNATGPCEADIVGFEILPAPYALAHYRLNMLEKSDPGKTSKVKLLLTNTLSDNMTNLPVTPEVNLFQAEQNEAKKSILPPIVLIIGNPPSSDSTNAPHLFEPIYSKIMEELEGFRPPAGERRSRQNIQKQINNEFVRFLRWSCARIFNEDKAGIAFVLPEAFLEHTSYKYAREWLATHFDGIWILEIDKDVRAGAASSGIFNTLQGRALFIALKGIAAEDRPESKINHGSITDLSIVNKKEVLNRNIDLPFIEEMFSSSIPDDDYLARFRPSESFDEEAWERCWQIYSSSNSNTLEDGEKTIFVRHVSGLKLAATGLVVHANGALLRRRAQEIGQSDNYDSIKEKWFSGQRKPPSVEKVSHMKSALREAAGSSALVAYSHRPFVNLNAMLNPAVLSALESMPGGGARSRPEIRKAFGVDNLGFAIAPSRKDLGDLHRFVSFSWHVPDNDLCKRGNAQILCKMFPDYKRAGGEWNDTPHLNISSDLLNSLPELTGLPKEDAIIFYSYAILCSNAYLEKFSGALFTTASSDTIPRIPIAADSELFEAISMSGMRLALLENPEKIVELTDVRQSVVDSFEATDDLKLLNCVYENESNTVYLVGIGLSGKNEKLIGVPNVNPDVLDLMISGYSIVREWVKWHSYPYTRVALDREVVNSFVQLITKVEKQLEEIEELDNHVENLLEPLCQWI